MSKSGTSAGLQVSERFPSRATSDADLIVKSSDGMHFHVHRTNLEMHSEGFPGADTVITTEDVVGLSESSGVLELMFQYMYRQPQPDLSGVPFQTLDALAEAVEKYRVYPAMEVCKLHMRDAIPDHPMEVFAYSVRHGYYALCDAAAIKTIHYPLNDALRLLEGGACLAWATYREQWISIYMKVMIEPDEVAHSKTTASLINMCEYLWTVTRDEIRANFVTHGLKSFEKMDVVFQCMHRGKDQCKFCMLRCRRWKELLEEAISKIEPFSSVMATMF